MAIRRRGTQTERINEYIGVWAGDQPEQLSFDGTVFWLPPRDEIARKESGGRYMLEAAKSRAGEPIPGCVVISDRTTIIDGVRVKLFDADMFVQWITRYRADLLDRGFAIVDLPEEVEEAKATGRPLWEQSEDRRARGILEREFARRLRYESKGLQAPVSTSEHLVLWAVKHLAEREAVMSSVSTDAIRAALGGVSLPTQPRPQAPSMPSAAPRPRSPLPQNAGGAELWARAKTLGVKVKKEDMEGLLEDDPATCKEVAAKVAEKELQLEELAQDATEAAAAS